MLCLMVFESYTKCKTKAKAGPSHAAQPDISYPQWRRSNGELCVFVCLITSSTITTFWQHDGNRQL
jgi:hypothetical protein